MKPKTNLPIWIYDLQFFCKENNKGLIIFLAFISIIAYFIIQSSTIREKDSTRFSCKVNCTVQRVEPNKIAHQDFDGGHVSINSYTVTFYYEVDGISYTNKNVILNNRANKELIDRLYKNNNKKLIAKYKCQKPFKSMIVIEKF